MIAAGAKIPLPDPEAARADFDRALIEDSTAIAPERRILLEALGVSDAG